MQKYNFFPIWQTFYAIIFSLKSLYIVKHQITNKTFSSPPCPNHRKNAFEQLFFQRNSPLFYSSIRPSKVAVAPLLARSLFLSSTSVIRHLLQFIRVNADELLKMCKRRNGRGSAQGRPMNGGCLPCGHFGALAVTTQ